MEIKSNNFIVVFIILATPQILLQRPYDGGVVPVQNQQFVVTPTAPMASPIPPKPQPVMFRTALNRV